MHRKVPAGFGGRLRGKGHATERDLAAQPILLRGVPGKHAAQVSLAEDQHPVGDLGSDGQHEAFGAPVAGRWQHQLQNPFFAAAFGFVGLARRHDLAVAGLQPKPVNGQSRATTSWVCAIRG